jgi:serine/threonine kinase PknH
LLAAWAAVLVVTPLSLMGCAREVAGSGAKASSTVAADPASVLLDAGEVDDVLEMSGLEVLDEGNAPDDTADVTPPQCHGLVYIAGEKEYGSTDFTAIGWRIVGTANASILVEAVADLPSAAKADEFIDQQATAWKGCVDKVITSKDKGGAWTTEDRVTEVKARPHMVVASSDSESGGSRCQHVLQAVSNVIVEVSLCDDKASGRAEAVASKLADKVGSG